MDHINNANPSVDPILTLASLSLLLSPIPNISTEQICHTVLLYMSYMTPVPLHQILYIKNQFSKTLCGQTYLNIYFKNIYISDIQSGSTLFEFT